MEKEHRQASEHGSRERRASSFIRPHSDKIRMVRFHQYWWKCIADIDLRPFVSNMK